MITRDDSGDGEDMRHEEHPAGPPDVRANRDARKWSRKEQVARVFWVLALPLFRYSPRPVWGWRRGLLRLFGARVGAAVHIYPSVRLTMPWNMTFADEAAVGEGAILYALGPMRIGARATISQYAHLCGGTHAWRDPARPLVKSPITIEDGAWICADAFIGPNVRVGAGAIVGARAVAMRDVPAFTVVAGNPGRPIRRIPANEARDETSPC